MILGGLLLQTKAQKQQELRLFVALKMLFGIRQA